MNYTESRIEKTNVAQVLGRQGEDEVSITEFHAASGFELVLNDKHMSFSWEAWRLVQRCLRTLGYANERQTPPRVKHPKTMLMIMGGVKDSKGRTFEGIFNDTSNGMLTAKNHMATIMSGQGHWKQMESACFEQNSAGCPGEIIQMFAGTVCFFVLLRCKVK